MAPAEPNSGASGGAIKDQAPAKATKDPKKKDDKKDEDLVSCRIINYLNQFRIFVDFLFVYKFLVYWLKFEVEDMNLVHFIVEF